MPTFPPAWVMAATSFDRNKTPQRDRLPEWATPHRIAVALAGVDSPLPYSGARARLVTPDANPSLCGRRPGHSVLPPKPLLSPVHPEDGGSCRAVRNYSTCRRSTRMTAGLIKIVLGSSARRYLSTVDGGIWRGPGAFRIASSSPQGTRAPEVQNQPSPPPQRPVGGLAALSLPAPGTRQLPEIPQKATYPAAVHPLHRSICPHIQLLLALRESRTSG